MVISALDHITANLTSSRYHAHYQVQYSDGAAGPLLLYGPSSANYDEAWPPIFMNDWVHDNASVAFEQELNGGIPVVDNILLDGQGELDPRVLV